MTSTLRMRLKEALEDEDYIEFLSIIYENNLEVNEDGWIGASSDEVLEDSFVDYLQKIPVSEFLWHVFEFISTTFDSSDRRSPVAYNSITTDDSSTSESSLGFVDF